MDPVSKLLAERERARAGVLPFVAAALALHASVAAAAFLIGRGSSARPAQLPAVSVKIVRPQPQRRPQRDDSGERRVPTPAPTRKPPPQPTAQPTAAPTMPPAAVEPPAERATSDDAMPAASSRSTPRPTSPPREPEYSTRGGLSLGRGDRSSGSSPGIPSDFQFAYYVERMLALIESRWYKPPVPRDTRARARFRILKDGRLEGIQLEASSGNSSFDRAVLRALYAANPLPPLPPGYRKPSLTVHLTFSE